MDLPAGSHLPGSIERQAALDLGLGAKAPMPRQVSNTQTPPPAIVMVIEGVKVRSGTRLRDIRLHSPEGRTLGCAEMLRRHLAAVKQLQLQS